MSLLILASTQQMLPKRKFQTSVRGKKDDRPLCTVSGALILHLYHSAAVQRPNSLCHHLQTFGNDVITSSLNFQVAKFRAAWSSVGRCVTTHLSKNTDYDLLQHSLLYMMEHVCLDAFQKQLCHTPFFIRT